MMSDCKHFPCPYCNGFGGLNTDCCGFCGQYEAKSKDD